MPFVSKAQARKFQNMEAKGEIAKGTTAKWMAETPRLDSLPERKKPSRPQTTAKASSTRAKPMGWYR